jgi:hypothetical protein
MTTGVTGWSTAWKTSVVAAGRMKIPGKAGREVGSPPGLTGVNGRKNAPQAGRGIGTRRDMMTGRVTRNGAAGAPGKIATGMADMTARQTLGEAGTTGNGHVGIEEIAIAIEKGARTGTGIVVAMSTPADEWPGSCAFLCRTR